MVNTERLRLAGVACAIGGALWVITLLAGVAAGEAVTGNLATFRVWEAVLLLVQILLLIGLLGLAWSGAVGEGWLGRIGLGIAILARLAFVLAEVQLLIQGNKDTPLLPLGALGTGIGMIVVGIAVLRTRRWGGWRRPLPLLAGLYPFVAMFPILAATGQPPELMIALWGVLWLLLGFALRAEAGAPAAVALRPLAAR